MPMNAIPLCIKRVLVLVGDAESVGAARSELVRIRLSELRADREQEQSDSYNGVFVRASVGDSLDAATLVVLGRLLSSHGMIFVPSAVTHDLTGSGFRLYRKEPIVVLVLEGYESADHALSLLEAGKPDWAFEVLEYDPEDYAGNPEKLYKVALAKQTALLAWREGGDRVKKFSCSSYSYSPLFCCGLGNRFPLRQAL